MLCIGFGGNSVKSETILVIYTLKLNKVNTLEIIFMYNLLYLSFGWIGFYGISTMVGNLMPKPFYTSKQFYFKQFSLILVQFLFTHS